MDRKVGRKEEWIGKLIEEGRMEGRKEGMKRSRMTKKNLETPMLASKIKHKNAVYLHCLVSRIFHLNFEINSPLEANQKFRKNNRRGILFSSPRDYADLL